MIILYDNEQTCNGGLIVKNNINSRKKHILKISLLATSVLTTTVSTVSAEQLQNEKQSDLLSKMTETSTPHTIISSEDLSNSNQEANQKDETAPKSLQPMIEKVDPSHIQALWEKVGTGEGDVLAVIDSGIETKHSMLQLPEDADKMYTDQASIDSKKQLLGIERGQWINDKLPFYHDYTQGQESIDRNTYHGTHVAGIATASGLTQKENKEQMQGIVPNAQLLFLKVGQPSVEGEREKHYAMAIKDAIALGATAINMSFGQVGKASHELNDDFKKALALAADKGVAIVVAAGNDYAMGGSQTKPLAKNPDTGVIGTPATTEEVFTVAAYVAPHYWSRVLSVTDGSTSKALALEMASPFAENKDYELIFLEKGLETEENAERLKNKVLVLNYDFVTNSKEVAEKVEALGAAGVLVHNNQAKKPLIPLAYNGPLPMGFISKEDADWLKTMTSPQFRLKKEKQLVEVTGGRQMTNFSSWGLSVDGNMKPDFAAPGYEIYSPTPGNDYSKMSGTSAASPHAMGIIHLVRKHIQKEYPHLSAKEQLQLVKNLLMSTASPIYSELDHSYYSPRVQGAGALDGKKALETDVYVTAADGLSKIQLGDVNNQFELRVTLHNLSNQEKNFTYFARVLTDKVEKGRILLRPQELYQTRPLQVKLAPNQKQEVVIKVDISNFDQQLKAQMPNGYFLDGFVVFQSKEGAQKDLSIPFIAFKGKFADLEALDSPIYRNLDGTFYYSPKEGQDPYDFEVDSIQQIKEQYMTGLITTFTPWSLVEGSKIDGFSPEMASEFSTTDYLGSYNKEGDNTVRRFRFVEGKPYLALSPNGDDNMDKVGFRGVFLRNVRDIKAQVFASDDLQHPIWESPIKAFAKKDVNTNDIKESMLENTVWEGKDASGNPVTEGLYRYRVTYTPLAEGAKEQFIDFDILVDLTPSKLPQSAILMLAERRIELTESRDYLSHDTYRDRLYYKYGTDDINFITFEKDDMGHFVIPNQVEDELSGEKITINLDKTDHFFFVREDFSGNFSVISLSQLLNNHSDQMNSLQESKSDSKESNTGDIRHEKQENLSQQTLLSTPSIDGQKQNDQLMVEKEKDIMDESKSERSEKNKFPKVPASITLKDGTLHPQSISQKTSLPKTVDSQKTMTFLGIAMLFGGILQVLWSYFKKRD